ncbi:uncharacterized protein F5891DRAFT_1170427 [Suillus fuscotomentosus]|uniref:Nitrogen regulatory protein areA GATA-like domain-containing protein n=1 Tax=Suillus fuscotomentosus TaxID=1912939 RepID=A0AAD4EI28_9AGAM|nr:uncharacterized protein F5891DRAFT_1170427 [Suillus fuscotomentosus]KAG1905388.1 hypothetical protein F5891DRAFT_1170427 [Suillus fuscotomentosus]
MITSFPAPVLSVTPDAVKDLQGQDALSALWTIFTKCKESLQDGRRLENISWRLWHRELILSQQSYLPPTPDSISNLTVSSDTRNSFFPLTDPVEVVQPLGTPPCPHSTSTYQHPPSPASTTSPVVPERLCIPQISSGTPVAPPLSTSFRPKSSSFVGRIIIDMLPNNVLIPDKTPSPCSLQQPPVPSVQLPSTPTSTEAYFPRVVVVNPTPQPTPPMTPSLSEERTSASQPPSTFLLPPLPPPTLIMKRQAQAEQPLPQSTPPDGLLPSLAPVRGAESSKVSGRFFLQQSPEDASPERDGSTESGKSRVDLFDASSVASSQMHSTDIEKEVTKELKEKDRASTRPKKGKELGRSSARPALAKRTYSARHIGPSIQRKHSNQDSKPRAMFNIGSNSSNGSKSAQGSSVKLTPPPPPPPAPVVNGLGAAINGMAAINVKPARPVVAPPSTASGNTVVNGNANGVGNTACNGTGPQQRKTILRKTGLRGAALEAQRQRDLFAKVPKRSYSNLDRTQSGLLSQLMNPNPTIFPSNHPYRLSQSTADLVRMQRQAQRQAEQAHAPQRSVSGFAGPARLQTSKSSAALPLAAQITAVSSSKPPSSGMKGTENEKGGYRPKGRPKEEEMEDESGEDEDDDDEDDKIQVSRSVAQQRLQALMSRRPPENGNASQVTPHTHICVVENHIAPAAQSTAPIPLGHPYNLPAPALPMTPRTTRRIMLRTELSESMRRQLLWERQVSSTTNPAANARRTNNGVLGGLRPLASTTSVGENPSATKSAEAQDRDERRQRAMARNRSWADDYHYSGW